MKWLDVCIFYMNQCSFWLLSVISSSYFLFLSLLKNNNLFCTLFHVIRPANVPAGAHVQWEIELLGFEMPKVQIYEMNTIVIFKNFKVFQI